MEMTMSQIDKLAIQIANDLNLKQIKTRRQNRYNVTMIKIEKLGANITRDLQLIKYDDKIDIT